MTRDRALLFEDVRLIEKRIRHVLERHAFGHVPSVGADGEQPS